MESPSMTGSPCLSYDVDQARLVLLQDGERHEISIRAQARALHARGAHARRLGRRAHAHP
jgi:hypothetical protein